MNIVLGFWYGPGLDVDLRFLFAYTTRALTSVPNNARTLDISTSSFCFLWLGCLPVSSSCCHPLHFSGATRRWGCFSPLPLACDCEMILTLVSLCIVSWDHADVKDVGYVIVSCNFFFCLVTHSNNCSQNYDFPNNCEDYIHRIGRTGVCSSSTHFAQSLTVVPCLARRNERDFVYLFHHREQQSRARARWYSS